MPHWGGRIFFVSTEGGGPLDSDPPPNASAGFGDGYGQVWTYDTRMETLTLLFESPGPAVLDFPDNVVVSPRRKSVLICEDSTEGNMLRGLTRRGCSSTSRSTRSRGGPTSSQGRPFSPDAQVLYANLRSNVITYAIWGPWHRGPL